MLNMHPGKRISPEEILEHEFLAAQYAYDLDSNAAGADREETDGD